MNIYIYCAKLTYITPLYELTNSISADFSSYAYFLTHSTAGIALIYDDGNLSLSELRQLVKKTSHHFIFLSDNPLRLFKAERIANVTHKPTTSMSALTYFIKLCEKCSFIDMKQNKHHLSYDEIYSIKRFGKDYCIYTFECDYETTTYYFLSLKEVRQRFLACHEGFVNPQYLAQIKTES